MSYRVRRRCCMDGDPQNRVEEHFSCTMSFYKLRQCVYTSYNSKIYENLNLIGFFVCSPKTFGKSNPNNDSTIKNSQIETSRTIQFFPRNVRGFGKNWKNTIGVKLTPLVFSGSNRCSVFILFTCFQIN